ncbi:mucin-16-like [Rhineura floridana]|uniref:mucin-16-like n=1 Tax=Rhineura floridana TaxID=261503 RepID=UPI002AC83A0B|nr:mucin-16-like [Rhineura floridana]
MVDTLCTFRRELLSTPFDRVRVYHELSNLTVGSTKLGHYSMKNGTLYVNGYPPSPTGAPEGVGYGLGFTIINKNLTHTDPSSPEYQRLQSAISDELNQVFLRSAIRNGFNICKVTGLRYGSIVVDCNCYFDPEMNIDQDTITETFQQATKNSTSQWLGNQFQLKGVIVRGPEPIVEALTNAPPPQLKLKDFTVSFTTTNLPYTAEMEDSNSDVYWHTKISMESKLSQLYRRSDLGTDFIHCSVENFSPTGQKNQTAVGSVCTFAMHSSRSFNKALVYDVFKNQTGKAGLLGKYTLEDGSLLVSGYPSAVAPEHHKEDLPFWAIILICLSVLLGFILFFFICFLIAFCLRKGAGKYQLQQNIFGTYFPHLDM